MFARKDQKLKIQPSLYLMFRFPTVKQSNCNKHAVEETHLKFLLMGALHFLLAWILWNILKNNFHVLHFW